MKNNIINNSNYTTLSELLTWSVHFFEKSPIVNYLK